MDRHLEVEILSALADGELDLSAARNAQRHLVGCELCSAQLAAFRGLDSTLAMPAPISCASAVELRSAFLDRELTQGEAAVASAHIASCDACRAEQVAWSAADAAVRALPPALPSAAVDARVARLTTPSARHRVPRASGGISVLAMRGAVAAVVVLAILVGLLPAGAPETAEVPGTEQAIVAGVQQAVLYTPTNTLYVLQTAVAAVDAMDANTYALRTRIAVGGRPTALALNEAASLILVLDPSQRSLVQIDAQRNEVVATTSIEGIGTPTAVHVEPGSGKIILAAIPDQPVGGAAPTPTVGTNPSAGVVAVLDPNTKKLQTVKTVDVAPQVVVTDASGKRTLLVSAGATQVVDPSYRTLRTLQGGIAAAFGGRTDLIAVLAVDGPGAAVIYFTGDGAPGPLRLPGVPLAMTSIPEVGFAVLLGSGSGNGRIVVVDEAGRDVGTTPVAASARDLTWDPSSRKFTVVGGGKVASAQLPATVALVATPLPELSLPVSARPSPSAAPERSSEPTSSRSPEASPSAPPGGTAAPVASTVPLPSVAPALPAGIPAAASIVLPDLYRLDLRGRIPLLMAATPRRMWFVDSKNELSALDMDSGALFTLAQLPRDAEITALAIGAAQVYAADGKHGRLFILDTKTERWAQREVPFLHGTVAMIVAPDGRLWLGMDDSAQAMSFDPRTNRVETVDTGLTGIAALAIDNAARLWFIDGDHLLGSYDLRNGRITQIRLPGRGAARALLPDPTGSVWVGTTAGEVVSVRDGSYDIVASTGRPIARLSLDLRGTAWYLTPSAGQIGFTYASLDGRASRVIPGPASSLDFGLGGVAWVADPSGGFYVAPEASR